MASDSDDLDSARDSARGYLGIGLSPSKVRRSLNAEGFDAETVRLVVSEYIDLFEASQRRKKTLWRIAGFTLFIVSSGLFVYYAFFFSQRVALLAPGLLFFAAIGLLKALLP